MIEINVDQIVNDAIEKEFPILQSEFEKLQANNEYSTDKAVAISFVSTMKIIKDVLKEYHNELSKHLNV